MTKEKIQNEYNQVVEQIARLSARREQLVGMAQLLDEQEKEKQATVEDKKDKK